MNTNRPPKRVGKRLARTDVEASKLIGQKIKARRLELEISQEALGKAIGVSFQQVQKYERGSNRISVPRLEQIAIVLQLSAAEFMQAGVKRDVTPYSAFLATKEGADIVKAMLALNKVKRRWVIGLARQMAAGNGEACP